MIEPNTASEARRLLDSLVEQVDPVDGAVVLSRDGMVVATSGLGRENSEHLSALVSGVQGLARGACRRFDGGDLLQTVIEMESVFLFMVNAGDDMCLAVLCHADADAGVVAYEMTELAERLAEHVPAGPRFSGTGVG